MGDMSSNLGYPIDFVYKVGSRQAGSQLHFYFTMWSVLSDTSCERISLLLLIVFIASKFHTCIKCILINPFLFLLQSSPMPSPKTFPTQTYMLYFSASLNPAVYAWVQDNMGYLFPSCSSVGSHRLPSSNIAEFCHSSWPPPPQNLMVRPYC